VLGLDGLTVGDCVGVVGGGPDGVDGEDDVEGADDCCACAGPIKTPAPTTIVHPLIKSCATTSRSNLLLGIAVSFEPSVRPK
jgi:hypothetical protein